MIMLPTMQEHVDSRYVTSKRVCSLDEAAFDRVTEASAYWAGFLMADGCIWIDPRRKVSPRVQLVLAAQDADHVRAFQAFMRSTHAVRVRSNRVVYAFASNRVVAALARLGVLPRKTFSAEARDGMERDRHFWRGVIDGDGHVGWHTGHGHRYPRIRLVGALPLLTQFVAFVRSLEPTDAEPRPQGKIWSVDLVGRPAYRVAAALYSDCRVALYRKHVRAVKVIEEFASC